MAESRLRPPHACVGSSQHLGVLLMSQQKEERLPDLDQSINMVLDRIQSLVTSQAPLRNIRQVVGQIRSGERLGVECPHLWPDGY